LSPPDEEEELLPEDELDELLLDELLELELLEPPVDELLETMMLPLEPPTKPPLKKPPPKPPPELPPPMMTGTAPPPLTCIWGGIGIGGAG
jgi:hypothetical protein